MKTCRVSQRFLGYGRIGRLYQVFPKFPGYWKVLEGLGHLLPRSALVFDAIIELENRSVTVPIDIRDPYQIDIFVKNKKELSTPTALSQMLNPGDFYFDVGANAGWFFRMMVNIVGEEGLVVALEPNRRAFDSLIKLAYPNFLPLPFAATEKNGQHLTERSHALHSAASSKYFSDISPATVYGAGEQFVLGRSLDHLLSEFRRKPNVIKIDVEGAELHVLKGASEALAHAKAVVVEVNDEQNCALFGYKIRELYDFMSDRGFVHWYELRNSDSTIRSITPGNLVAADVLFLRSPLPMMPSDTP